MPLSGCSVKSFANIGMVMPALAFLVGPLVLLVVLQDAFEVMLLPRRVQRRLRFVRLYFRQTWRLFAAFARNLPEGARRESLLSVYGPLAMVLLFGIWSLGLILAFGLLEWALHVGTDKPLGLLEAIYLSGVTFFTLGYGDLVPHTALARALAVGEAGIGLGFIAVVISYLPVLYQLFARREAHVILLDGRAGSPPTAGGMILRHARGGGLAQLDAVLSEWERWGAELLESQLSYPMLAFYRSQHDNQSWIAALACIMDTCALVLVGIEVLPPLQARMTFTMNRQVLVQMAEAFAMRPEPFSGGERLDTAGYVALEQVLVAGDVGWSAGDASRETLAALRGTYEPLLAGLASFLLVPLPGWLPHDDVDDHWSSGHRGALTRRLIEDLSMQARPDEPRRRVS